jgi:hypothetical protein
MGFTACILEENKKMIHLISQSGCVSMKKVLEEYHVTALF